MILATPHRGHVRQLIQVIHRRGPRCLRAGKGAGRSILATRHRGRSRVHRSILATPRRGRKCLGVASLRKVVVPLTPATHRRGRKCPVAAAVAGKAP